MTTIIINNEPQYLEVGPPGVFVPLAEVDALQRQMTEQLAALLAERDGLRELERLAIEVADYIRDTSWSMGPIRKLVEYIDNKNNEQK